MAGGPAAVHRAKEGVEDDAWEGERAMRRLRPTRKDVVIGISASGITPFVRGAVARARAAKIPIIGVTCDPRSELKDFADVTIVLTVGPEVIAGSTRLKAGTATKIVLNMLTTAAMVRAGKTYGNLMVDVKSNSDKLRDRGRRIIGAVTGLDYDAADALLRRAKWNVKAAIVMQQTGETYAAALSRLRVEPRLRKLLGRR
jgi:N-acetylmuramic acid 6-phosphate etherase